MVKGGNSVFASSEDETKVAYAVDGGNIYFDKGTGAVYGYD